MAKTDVAIELNTHTVVNVYDKDNNQKFSEIYNSSSGGYKLLAIVDGIAKYI